MNKILTVPCVALGLFATAAAAPSPALAHHELPPQVLGLIATAQPIPLQCNDGQCHTILSSFCLQEDRPVPEHGQKYDVAGLGDVTLVVTKADGAVSEFAATGLLNYASEDDFTRVRVSMDEERLASLDATSVSVRVEPMVSLMPRLDEPVADAVAARDEETAFGAPRMVAEGFFKPGLPRSDAAYAMTRLIGLLPQSGPVAGSASPAVRSEIWDKVTTSGALEGLSSEGVSRAKTAIDRCGAYADMGVKLTLRGCLETSHGRLMRELNDEYWESDPAGY